MHLKSRLDFLALLILLAVIVSFYGAVADEASSKEIRSSGYALSPIRSDCEAVELSFSLFGLECIPEETREGRYALVKPGECGFTAAIGKPRLPVIRKFIEIPESASFELFVEKATFRNEALSDLGAAGPIVPAQEAVPVIPGAIEAAAFRIDRSVYASDAYVLEETVRVSGEVRMRGRRLLVLEIFPVNYRPLSGTVRVLEAARIVFSLSGSDADETLRRLTRFASPHYDRLARDLITNAAAFDPNPAGGPRGGTRGTGYLMIADPAFTGNAKLQELIALRTAEGYDVTLVDTATTGTSATDIQGYIQQAYDTWNPPPESVLLIGDTDTIPHFIGKGADTPATDP